MSPIINSLRSVVETAPDRWEARLALVEALLKEGSHHEAAQVLQQVTELPVELAERVLAGRAYGLFDPEIGLEVLEQVLQIEPAHAAAHFEKAKLCLHLAQ